MSATEPCGGGLPALFDDRGAVVSLARRRRDAATGGQASIRIARADDRVDAMFTAASYCRHSRCDR